MMNKLFQHITTLVSIALVNVPMDATNIVVQDEFQQRNQQGVELLRARKYTEAEVIFRAGLQERPGDCYVRYQLASTLYHLQRYQESIDVNADVTSGTCDDLAGGRYLQMGNAYDALGQPNDAIGCYKKALALDPTNALIHYNLAVTYHAQRNRDSALRYARSSASLNHKHVSSHIALAELYEAMSYHGYSMTACIYGLIQESRGRKASHLRDILSTQLSRVMSSAGERVAPTNHDQDSLRMQEIRAALSNVTHHEESSSFIKSMYGTVVKSLVNNEQMEAVYYLLVLDPEGNASMEWQAKNPSMVANYRTWAESIK